MNSSRQTILINRTPTFFVMRRFCGSVQSCNGFGGCAPRIKCPLTLDTCLDVRFNVFELRRLELLVEKCIEQAIHEIEVLQPTHFSCFMHFGGMDQRRVMRSMDLFGSKVMPAVEKHFGGLDHIGTPHLKHLLEIVVIDSRSATIRVTP